jgi:hypothetical protein
MLILHIKQQKATARSLHLLHPFAAKLNRSHSVAERTPFPPLFLFECCRYSIALLFVEIIGISALVPYAFANVRAVLPMKEDTAAADWAQFGCTHGYVSWGNPAASRAPRNYGSRGAIHDFLGQPL